MSPTQPTSSTQTAKKQTASKSSAHKVTKSTPQHKQQQDLKHRDSQQRLRGKLDKLYEDILAQVDAPEDVNAKQKTAVLSLVVEAIDHHLLERQRLLVELTALGVPIEQHLLQGHYSMPQPQQAAPVTQGPPPVVVAAQDSPSTRRSSATQDPPSTESSFFTQDPPSSQHSPPTPELSFELPPNPYDDLLADFSGQFDFEQLAFMFEQEG